MSPTKERTGSVAPSTVPPASAPLGRPAPSAETPAERVVTWVRKHPQITTWTFVIIAAAVGFFVWNLTTTRESEAEARSSLQGARVAFESRNMGLASSELARVRENYAGTKAAEEATLLLAQVRLQQGQRDQAIQLLRDFAPTASRDYRAQAFGLLGGAIEDAARPGEAAQAYQSAAEAAGLAFLQAQFWSDAGRAWTNAGDTAQAVAAYRRITTTDLKESASAVEATVRLGELTRGADAPSP